MVASLEKIESTLQKVTLNPQQQAFCDEFLEWLEFIPNRLQTLCGYAGAGKSFTIKHALIQAHRRGLLSGGQVVACAPTHQAKAVLQRALEGAPVDEISTSHSILQLRPRTVEFNEYDDARLEVLLSIPKGDRSSDETALIDWLQVKQCKAAEQVQEFVSQGSLTKLQNVRLIIVDEAGMADSYMFGLFCSLLDNPDPTVQFHPDLQILFMGDPAQLPPINETIGKAFTLPRFTELTQVMRYKGAILEYCNGVRVDPNYETLHRRITEDDSFLTMPSYEVFTAETLKAVYESETVRFVAATNKRVAELNYIIRSLLKSNEGQNALFYEPGDIILTMAAVQHDTNGYYDIACNARKAKLEIHTSTLVELGDPVLPGQVVAFENGYSTMVTNRSLQYKSALGTTFRRLIYRYRVYGAGEPFTDTKAICLIDPEQFSLWKDECDRLLTLARSSRNKGGKVASEVWAVNGMKSWEKWLDGTTVTKVERERIHKSLWANYFALVQFADNASFSYASTTHRCLPGDTLIKCEGNRLIPLNKLSVGDYVANGLGGFSRVMNFWETGVKESITITTRSGLKIKTSLDHKFLASQDEPAQCLNTRWFVRASSFIEAGKLNTGDYLAVDETQCQLPEETIKYYDEDRHYFYDKIVSIEKSDSCEMFDIEVEHHHQFVANGFVVHNCQGSTVDVIVVDVNDILGNGRTWKADGENTWDTRKLLYTAASRAAKQLVFLV